MIENRDYMRETPLTPARSLTVALIIINAVIFFLQLLLERIQPGSVLDRWLALSAERLARGEVWRLLTFQFLHGGLLHLLLNSWALYVFGRSVEATLGRGRFLQLYLGSGVVGGLMHVAGSALLPQIFGPPQVQVVGASAGLYGVIAAFAVLFPHQPLTLLLFFVLPITLSARVLLIASVALALIGLLMPQDNVAHGAHLGGMLAGYLFLRWGDAVRERLEAWRQRPARRRPRELAQVGSRRRLPWGSTREDWESELPPDEFIRREVDPILDKISAHGIHSLTERERRILEAARKKMTRR
ncbi:MAG: rhomboid family intramembrane serine protease [Verrucomicrobiae bacterium]|nr:rhomboid family intramembrane serine protease [Verrucomicrobiae bacterium]